MKRLLLLLLLAGVFGPYDVQARFLRGGLAGIPAPPSGGITGVTVTPSVFAGGSPANTVVGAVAVATQPTMSVAPGGAPIVIASGPSAGTWSWGAISSTPPNYLIALNGVASGAFYAIQMAAGSDGVLYDLNATSGWYQAFNNGSGVSAPAGPPGPAFTGTLSLGGPDVSKFALTSSTLPANVVTVGVVPNGSYNITITPTQAGIGGSGTAYPISLSGVTSTSPSITVSNLSPNAGDTVTVTVNPGTLTSGTGDSLVWSWGSPGRYNCLYGPFIPPVGLAGGPQVLSVQIPYAPSEVPQKYVLNYNVQDTTTGTHCDGDPRALAAVSSVITVAPTLTPPTITATPPADVTAYPAGWPNPPARILTVCASGCAYTSFSDAAWDAANNSPVDFTQILLKPETYVDVCRFGELSGNPSHVWIIAKGGGMAKLTTNNPNCNIIGGNNHFQGQMILDNLDISEFSAGNVGGIGSGGNCPNFLLRNVYLHDGGMGIIVGLGCSGMNVTILNSRFTRLGGANGPSHAIYLNDPNKNNSFTIKRSVFEGVTVGHTIKTHFALPSVVDCSMVVQAYNNLYYGSEVVDLDEGGGQVTVQNSLLAHGPYYNTNGSSNQFSISFGIDGSGGGGNLNPQYLVLANDIFFNDLDGTGGANVNATGQGGNFVATGRQLFGANPPPPYSWSNSKFIGQLGAWQPGGSGTPFVTVPYYFPYCTSPSCSLQVTTSATDVDYGTPTTMDTGTPNNKSNLFYSTRATAGMGTIAPAPSTYYLWPYDSAKFPVPSICTDPIGNVTVP